MLFLLISRSCLLMIVLLMHHQVVAQRMIGIGTRFNDTFREWQITSEDDDVRGEIRMRWMMRDDWTVWDARLGDSAIVIQQKWKDDPDLWEIRCNGITVNARTAWPGDYTRWKLTDGRHQFNLTARYPNVRSEWVAEGERDTFFQVYMYWEGDPREWVIEDELSDDVSLAMRVGMAFLALHFSSPRL